MKYEVKTKLTGVKRNGKDGEFTWNEEIIYMKWGKEEERKEKGLLHISEYLGDIMMLSNKERSPRKEKKKQKKDKRKRPSA